MFRDQTKSLIISERQIDLWGRRKSDHEMF
jgi:hypothetical protein